MLKELERLRIPVDVIAGTSMGAIVGGLYASGMSATELEELVGSLDWAGALSDKPERARILAFVASRMTRNSRSTSSWVCAARTWCCRRA